MARPKSKSYKYKLTEEEMDNLIFDLAKMNCTWKEISDTTGMAERTIQRRFGDTYKRGYGTGKTSLKRTMWDIAINKKNVAMCIFLAKQMLNYTDKVEQKNDSVIHANANVTFEATMGNYVLGQENTEALPASH